MILYDTVFLCLTSLSMTISRSIHVAANGIITFFFMAEIYSIVYINHNFLIHLSVDGHLVCFHVSAIVNSVQWTLGCMYIFESCFFPDICPGVGLLVNMVALFLVFYGISILSSTVAISICIPTNSERGFLFLHTVSSIYCL